MPSYLVVFQFASCRIDFFHSCLRHGNILCVDLIRPSLISLFFRDSSSIHIYVTFNRTFKNNPSIYFPRSLGILLSALHSHLLHASDRLHSFVILLSVCCHPIISYYVILHCVNSLYSSSRRESHLIDLRGLNPLCVDIHRTTFYFNSLAKKHRLGSCAPVVNVSKPLGRDTHSGCSTLVCQM